jgi:hypothetical protein
MQKQVVVNNLMQKNYRYFLTASMGKNFDPDFRPDLSPKQMLRLGIFGGKYMRDCKREYPKDWFVGAKLLPTGENKADSKLNYFKVHASQSLKEWRRKGWINKQDPRGWFEWYCRYYMGRRSGDDARQIKRWRAMARHIAQIRNNCRSGDTFCRRRQRQALLHWAYDTRKL